MSKQQAIVYPTDFSKTALGALSWARRMAELLALELHCITVVQQPIFYAPVMDGASTQYPTLDELEDEADKQLKMFTDECLDGFTQVVVTRVLKGRAADEIVSYANEVDAAMVVMATHGRSGVAHLLIGSTAEGVVRQANCPVLSIHVS